MLESDYLDFTAPPPAESREHWKPENDDQANWCLEKISEAKAEIMDARAFYEAKMKQLDRWLENTIAPYNRDCEHFEALLAGYAEEALTGKKKRTISLPGGKFGFRKVPAKIDRDDAALLEFAETSAPEYVKIKKIRRLGSVEKDLQGGWRPYGHGGRGNRPRCNRDRTSRSVCM